MSDWSILDVRLLGYVFGCSRFEPATADSPMKLFCLIAAVVLTAFRICGVQTVIPDPKNKWEADHLYVIDKDTSSTFLNANLLYVRSLGADFP